ncbi:hydroxyethylthiazole kinase [Sansalvadorimonas verongulae]|uniref:hydroxyethylthiazole kinase n=1 Tax=Sansalvadorimonas verongulae TaxID=2172824 RepID=UPI0012BC9E7D|nr:hydroxyethylthiazole kinase [Sansalvadorimonas verongulae]MTI12802.1 hydroxyethylthiazole kinase [Sansalvadorimonas verongulae]
MTFKDNLLDSLAQLRQNTPLVLNMTNFVVMNNTANALLALGASPIMSDATEETPVMTDITNSLVINIGTLTGRTVMSMKCAASHAQASGKPWILDPVGAGATRFRLDTARLLLKYNPSVVRGNASEILALFKGESGGRGVDSLLDSQSVADVAVAAARKHNTVIAITGATDVITDGHQVLRLSNGHPMMARVTGTGCTASALVGAFLGTVASPLLAATAALACLGVAGEMASQNSRGPGSLQLNILDELYCLTPESLGDHLRMDITETEKE